MWIGYEFDAAGAFDKPTDESRAFILARVKAGAKQLTLDLWYTAWSAARNCRGHCDSDICEPWGLSPRCSAYQNHRGMNPGSARARGSRTCSWRTVISFDVEEHHRIEAAAGLPGRPN